MSKEKKYEDLEKQITPFKDILSKASDAVLEQEVSSYPIFVLSKQEIELGLNLKSEIDTPEDWIVNISTLEEFAAKQVIETSRINRFKKVYKDATKFLCLFVIDEVGATFVFLPRVSVSYTHLTLPTKA